jgi:hypothetical protein
VDEGELRALWQKKLAVPNPWQELPPAYRAHAQSLVPLLQGERVAAAMPLVLIVD